MGAAFVLAVAGLLAWKFMAGPNPYRDARAARELATHRLGEYLASQFPGKRVLVFSNPFVKRPETEQRIVDMEEAGLRGLEESLEGRMKIGAVVHPELRPEAGENPRAVPIDSQTTTPLSYLVAPDAFDRGILEHPDCEIVVSLIGLPVELDRCEAWKREGAPSFGLLLPDLRMVGGAPAVVAAIKSGKIAAMVLRKPSGVRDDVTPSNDRATEFDQRYLLVTRENVETIAAENSAILQSP